MLEINSKESENNIPLLEINGEIDAYCSQLIDTLYKWTKELKIDRLGSYGIIEKDVDKIVEKTGLKNNPVNLSKNNINDIVLNRI